MLKLSTVVAVVFSFIACEDDFETIGSSVIGEPGFNADLYDDAKIDAKTYRPGPVQTNNLQLNLLGIYQDPLFGIQEANILSSLELSNPNPSFGESPVLDSVVLSIPYFSREVASENGTRFELDSVYGNSAIKLSITESNFFLNSFDPDSDFEKDQKYYSNMGPRIESNLTSNVLYQNQSFTPSSNAVTEYTNVNGEIDTVTSPPALRLHLDKNFFQSKIIDKEGSTELLNQNNFRNYFRGIYFNVEQVNNSGSMMLLNMLAENAGITLYYTTRVKDVNDVDGDEDREELIESGRSFKLKFGESRVNTFNQDTPEFNDDQNLFLKGGEGSMAIIDLFAGPDANGDGVSDELEFLRESEWLINEANLVFNVNRSYMTGLNEPERVFIYDLNNNSILADYVLDLRGQMNSMISESNNKHLAPLKRDENGNGVSYQVRITGHIDNILNKDSTNVRLGLVVSQNVNLIRNSAVLSQENAEVSMVPSAAVLTPEATVLYGPNVEDDEKRLKLNIYYTEPKN